MSSLVSIISPFRPGFFPMHPYGLDGVAHVLESNVLLTQEVVRESLVATYIFQQYIYTCFKKINK